MVVPAAGAAAAVAISIDVDDVRDLRHGINSLRENIPDDIADDNYKAKNEKNLLDAMEFATDVMETGLKMNAVFGDFDLSEITGPNRESLEKLADLNFERNVKAYSAVEDKAKEWDKDYGNGGIPEFRAIENQHGVNEKEENGIVFQPGAPGFEDVVVDEDQYEDMDQVEGQKEVPKGRQKNKRKDKPEKDPDAWDIPSLLANFVEVAVAAIAIMMVGRNVMRGRR